MEAKGEEAPILHPGVPYKLRCALERKARDMAGYRYGRDLVNEYMDVLEGSKTDVMGNVDSFIKNCDDPRRVEIFNALRDVTVKNTVGVC